MQSSIYVDIYFKRRIASSAPKHLVSFSNRNSCAIKKITASLVTINHSIAPRERQQPFKTNQKQKAKRLESSQLSDEFLEILTAFLQIIHVLKFCIIIFSRQGRQLYLSHRKKFVMLTVFLLWLSCSIIVYNLSEKNCPKELLHMLLTIKQALFLKSRDVIKKHSQFVNSVSQ